LGAIQNLLAQQHWQGKARLHIQGV
jgi:hypothetical protein